MAHLRMINMILDLFEMVSFHIDRWFMLMIYLWMPIRNGDFPVTEVQKSPEAHHPQNRQNRPRSNSPKAPSTDATRGPRHEQPMLPIGHSERDGKMESYGKIWKGSVKIWYSSIVWHQLHISYIVVIMGNMRHIYQKIGLGQPTR